MICICKKSAFNKCAKCDVKYCSRECQVTDWKKHKLVCADAKITACKELYEKVKGNCAIMYAWYRQDITVELNETIEEYILTDTHFVHIVSNYINDENNIEQKITIKFQNYIYYVNVQFDNSQLIKNNYFKPDSTWSICL